MNKKLVISWMLLTLILSLFLIGCTPESSPEDEDPILKYCIFYQDELELELTYEQILAKINDAEKDKNLLKRTFIIDHDDGAVTLPDINLATVNITKETFKIERIYNKDIIIEDTINIWFNGLKAICYDYFSKEFDDTLYIKLRENFNYTKEICENTILPVRIIKEPIKVESVDLRLIDGTTEIKVNQTKGLRTYIFPQEASYQKLNTKYE